MGRRYGTINIRFLCAVVDDPTSGLIVDVWEGEEVHNLEESAGTIRLKASDVRVMDHRNGGIGQDNFIDWESAARRMDDAYNAGEALWSRLTPEECEALCRDQVRTLPKGTEAYTA